LENFYLGWTCFWKSQNILNVWYIFSIFFRICSVLYSLLSHLNYLNLCSFVASPPSFSSEIAIHCTSRFLDMLLFSVAFLFSGIFVVFFLFFPTLLCFPYFECFLCGFVLWAGLSSVERLFKSLKTSPTTRISPFFYWLICVTRIARSFVCFACCHNSASYQFISIIRNFNNWQRKPET